MREINVEDYFDTSTPYICWLCGVEVPIDFGGDSDGGVKHLTTYHDKTWFGVRGLTKVADWSAVFYCREKRRVWWRNENS
jgi:hypothetical protein